MRDIHVLRRSVLWSLGHVFCIFLIFGADHVHAFGIEQTKVMCLFDVTVIAPKKTETTVC